MSDRPTTIPFFFLGGAVPKERVGDMLEALYLANATNLDIAPFLNMPKAPARRGLSAVENKGLPAPKKVQRKNGSTNKGTTQRRKGPSKGEWTGSPPHGMTQTAWVEKLLAANHPEPTTRDEIGKAFAARLVRPESMSVALASLRKTGVVRYDEETRGIYHYVPEDQRISGEQEPMSETSDQEARS